MSRRYRANHFQQAMTGLHCDEWAGFPVRLISSIAGLLTLLLYISGIFLWWYSRSRANSLPKIPQAPVEGPVVSR